MVTPNGTILDDKYAYPLLVKVYEDLRKEDTAIAKKVWRLLDEEQFSIELVDNGTEWYFVTHLYGKFPNYAYNYLKRYINNNYGLRYLYG